MRLKTNMRNEVRDYSLFLCSHPDSYEQLICCYKRSSHNYQKNIPDYKKQNIAFTSKFNPLSDNVLWKSKLKNSQELVQRESAIANQTLWDLVNTLKRGIKYLRYVKASEKTHSCLSGPQFTSYFSKMLQTLKIHGSF